jgi:hypothetical protein
MMVGPLVWVILGARARFIAYSIIGSMRAAFSLARFSSRSLNSGITSRANSSNDSQMSSRLVLPLRDQHHLIGAHRARTPIGEIHYCDGILGSPESSFPMIS